MLHAVIQQHSSSLQLSHIIAPDQGYTAKLCCSSATLWPQTAVRLYSKALLQLLLDGLGQAACRGVPLTGSR